MKVNDAGRALGGRNGTIGAVIAPSLTRSVRSRPSLPMTYSGSTPPNGTGASRLLRADGGTTSRGAAGRGAGLRLAQHGRAFARFSDRALCRAATAPAATGK